MKRFSSEDRGKWKVELEWEAARRLCAHLNAGGEQATLVSRPDQHKSDVPAVDFELAVDGRAVGLEVTQILPAARSQYEIARIRNYFAEELDPLVQEHHLGEILLELSFGHLPDMRVMEEGASKLLDQIRHALDSLSPDPVGEIRLDLSKIVLARRVSIRQRPSNRDHLLLLTESDEWGGAIGPMAEEFVERLLTEKPKQTNAWDEAWIAIVDRIGLVDAENITAELRRRHPDIPTNWQRVYFLSAIDRSDISDLIPRLAGH